MEETSPPWLTPEAPESQPEGMLRISDGQSFQVIWPVHLAGWLALGWRLDWPETNGPGPSLRQEPAAPSVVPVITAVLGGPFHARAEKPYRVILQGSGFTQATTLQITASTGETISPTDLTYASPTEVGLSLDSLLLKVACPLTVVAAIGSLASLPIQC